MQLQSSTTYRGEYSLHLPTNSPAEHLGLMSHDGPGLLACATKRGLFIIARVVTSSPDNHHSRPGQVYTVYIVSRTLSTSIRVVYYELHKSSHLRLVYWPGLNTSTEVWSILLNNITPATRFNAFVKSGCRVFK